MRFAEPSAPRRGLPLVLLLLFGCLGLAAPAFSLHAQDSTAVVTSLDVRLRRAPSVTAPVLETLPRDASVILRARDGVWARVEYEGVTGWVRASQLRVTGPAASTGRPAPSAPPSSAGRRAATSQRRTSRYRAGAPDVRRSDTWLPVQS